jgi:hypothetical protein
MKIREIRLDDLVLDPNLNLRDRLDDFTVERYADSWDRLPPITVYQVEERLLLADGFHRHAAAVMLNKRTIAAEVIEGTMTDALDFVASVNLFHGLPLTRTERRRAVEIKLKLHPDWSDRRMAQELAVSRELVAKIRLQLIGSQQIPNLPGRVGADGKLYTSAGLPKDPNERLPKRGPEVDDAGDDRGRAGGRMAALPPWSDAGETSAAAKVQPRLAEPEGFATPPPSPRGAGGESGTASIEEMLELMVKYIGQVITWTQAEGFTDAYAEAKPATKNLFQQACFNLSTRAAQLRRG